jgi:carbamoyltransferase
MKLQEKEIILMAYNILGITPGHNGSVSLISNGKLLFYLEEDRLSKIKYDGNPLKTMVYVLERYKIDELVISGVSNNYIAMIPPPKEWEDIYTSLAKKYYPNIKTTNLVSQHHLTHASHTFYNSGFKKSSVIVIDNVGSYLTYNYKDQKIECHENETIFETSYPYTFKTVYKTLLSNSPVNINKSDLVIKNTLNITKLYELITKYLGWSEFEAGKTMGLSSYGKDNNKIPSLFYQGRGDSNLFSSFQDSGIINFDFSKIDPKDLAYSIQQESQKLVGDLVEKSIELTGLNNICITGGYGLNCVSNYYMLKRFPDVNFYHEPLAHDAGNSLGAALYRWYEYSKDTTIRPRKTLYNGPQYSKEELFKKIKKYV